MASAPENKSRDSGFLRSITGIAWFSLQSVPHERDRIITVSRMSELHQPGFLSLLGTILALYVVLKLQ